MGGLWEEAVGDWEEYPEVARTQSPAIFIAKSLHYQNISRHACGTKRASRLA